MSVIIVPRRHYAQPQGRVTVDPRFAPDFAWLPQYGGKRTTPGINTLGTVQTCSVATGGTEESSAAYVEAAGRSSSFGQRSQWVVVGGRFPNLTAPARLFGCGRPSELKLAALLQITTAGAIEFAINNGEWKSLLASASHRPDNVFFAGYSIDDNGLLRLFYNGMELGSQSGWVDIPTTLWAPTFGAVYASSGNTLIYGNGTEVSFAAFGNAGDVGGTALELTKDPWQLFRADPVRIYSLPSGAITLNSLTASNITQTGARITLGLTR